MKNKIIKKLLMLFGAVAAGVGIAGVVSYCVVERLVEIALDSEGPEVIEQSKSIISGVKIDREIRNRIISSGEELGNICNKTVEIVAHDGEILVGHLWECENPERVLIAMHGWRSSWTTDFGCISEFWHKNNCNVVYVEQRGQNNSGGKYIGFGMMERYDCADWIRFVNTRNGGTLPIYLVGLSMGATTVLMASGLSLPDNVRGIIADSGYTSLYAIWKHIAEKNLRMAYCLFGRMADGACRKKINMGTKDYSTLEALSNNDRPVLFIHGSDDHFVPVGMTYENYKACKAPKRLFVVPGAEHGMSYILEQDNYETAVKDFWTSYDKK